MGRAPCSTWQACQGPAIKMPTAEEQSPLTASQNKQRDGLHLRRIHSVDMAPNLAEVGLKGRHLTWRSSLQAATTRACKARETPRGREMAPRLMECFMPYTPEGRMGRKGGTVPSGCQCLRRFSVSEIQLKCSLFLFNCFKVGQSFHVLFLIYDGFCTQCSVSSFVQ